MFRDFLAFIFGFILPLISVSVFLSFCMGFVVYLSNQENDI